MKQNGLTIRCRDLYGNETVGGGISCYGTPSWTSAEWRIGKPVGMTTGAATHFVPITESEAVMLHQSGEGRAIICGPNGPAAHLVFCGPDVGWERGLWRMNGGEKTTLLDSLLAAPAIARVSLSDYQPVRNSAGCLFAVPNRDVI